MAEQSAVNRQLMGVAAQRIDSSANVIQGLRARLDEHKSDLLSGWEGDAASAFATVFARFHSDMGRVLHELEGMHKDMVHTRVNYEKTEQAQKDAVEKINALLNGNS